MAPKNTIREPTFDLNDFDQPKELAPPVSWMTDIIYLLFYEKGTFHDTPDIGVDINSQSFDNVEYIVYYLKNEITNQVNVHLSNIPVREINVTSYFWQEKQVNVLVVTVTFSIDNELVTAAAYITLVDETLTYIIRVLGIS